MDGRAKLAEAIPDRFRSLFREYYLDNNPEIV
jgi:hypothetical protein